LARIRLISHILHSPSSQYHIILELYLLQKASHTNKTAVSPETAQLPSVSSPFLNIETDASSEILAAGHTISFSFSDTPEQNSEVSVGTAENL